MTTEHEGEAAPPDGPEKPPGSAPPDPPRPEAPGEPVKAEASDEEELAAATQSELSLLAEAARFATPERVRDVIEALLFAAEKPLDVPSLVETTRFTAEQVQAALVELRARFTGGVRLVDTGGKLQLKTHPEVGPYVRRLLAVKPMRLTRAAMETLAIIAYRQPVTRPEMEDLRGVDCGAVTKALLERKLIRILGKKDEPGRPILYGTSKEFLELFSLRDLTQLPTLREFQELSEESRKIVEEEAPAAAAPIEELQINTATAERIAKAAAESDRALDALERAMDTADQRGKEVVEALAPPPPPGPEPQA